MHKIDAPNATGANEFTDGDPAQGSLATVLWSKWLNTVQRELVAICAAAGIPLDAANDAQVVAAIQTLISARTASFSTHASGVCISTVSFDVAANIGDTYRSIGPTGSGAERIWTALDGVPAGADWITIKVDLRGVVLSGTPGATLEAHVYAGVHGYPGAVAAAQEIAAIHGKGDTAGNAIDGYVGYTGPIRIDAARRFDMRTLFAFAGGVVTCTIHLVGFGFNP